MPIKEEYSSFKIVHHQNILQQLKNCEQPNPLQVQIVFSNKCSHRCSFCAYRMKDHLSNEVFDDRDELSYEKIIETFDSITEMGIKAIQITGGGEPLVHPQAKECIKYAFDKGLEVSLVTNGSHLDEELCNILGDAAWVRVSMDAATKESYSMIRNISQKSFEKTIENIKTLVKYRRQSIIGIGFVVNKENYKEIYDAAVLFKSLGVNNFRISAAFTPMGFKYFDGILNEARELSKKAESLSDESFTVFNLFNDRVKDTFEGTQDYDFCGIKDLLAYIGSDYNVYTCCTLSYNHMGLIGSIKEKSFKELWESDKKKNKFSSHNPHKHCQFPCMYKNKNEFINYCIKKNPRHVNYI